MSFYTLPRAWRPGKWPLYIRFLLLFRGSRYVKETNYSTGEVFILKYKTLFGRIYVLRGELT